MVWPRRVGDYIVSTLLGQGSFGEVRLAVHRFTRKEFAVKILRYDDHDFGEHSRDVRREMSILMALRHPFIITLNDVVYHMRQLYLVMELAETNLEAYVSTRGPLMQSAARIYFRQLVDGILHCHAHGVFHRDLKPENLLLTDDARILKVADFGFAGVIDKFADVDPIMRTVCGSGCFCAPEVATGMGYDGGLADAYSCGAVLCCMLGGGLGADDKWECPFTEGVDCSVRELVQGLTERNPAERLNLSNARVHAWVTMEEEKDGCTGWIEDDWFSLLVSCPSRSC